MSARAQVVATRVQPTSTSLMTALMAKLSALCLLVFALIGTAANAAPSVTLTAPANNSLYHAPANITVRANASAPARDTVTQVEFFANGTLIGTDTSRAFRINWTNVASGTYTLTARATDNRGAQSTSAARTIVVNAPPTVSLTAAPTTAIAPATIELTATASDTDGTITKVQFFRGKALIATRTTAPYTFTVSNLAAGSYSFTARATDNSGAVTPSAPVAVFVDRPPRVRLTAPHNHAVFAAPATINIAASARDRDGTVAKVEFFANGALIGTDTSAPFSFSWTDVAAGSYSLTARATDDKGAQSTSAARTITVDAPPTVSLTATPTTAVAPATIVLTATASDTDGTIRRVEFFRGNTRIATRTAAPYTFTVNRLGVGSYSFTARATDNSGFTTTSAAVVVVVTATSINEPPSVSLTSPANNASFTAPATIPLTATASDADGTIASVQFLNGASVIATLTVPPYAFDWTNVGAGSYTLTARATDNLGATTASSAVNVTVNANQPPSVTLTSPNNNAVFTAPATIPLTATASDTDGTIATVEFLNGANVIATLTNPPYTFDLTNVGVGSYTLTARATDDKGAQTTSNSVTVTVNAVAEAATIYYIYTDQLNTPRAITNEAATPVWKWDNVDPFGANAPNEDPDGDTNNFVFNLRFPGQYFDKETNTHYNYFRDYDPSQGRYVESDPIGLRGGMNTYAYVENNPQSYVDALGLCRVEVRFKPARLVGQLGIYHAYIVTTAPNGSQNYFRGGPTGRPTPAQPIWGNITTRYGAYGPKTPDWDPGTPPTVVLRDDDQPCDCYDAGFANTLNAIDAAGISYIPMRRNSNSVTGTALSNAGFGQFTPPVTTPALWNNLNGWLGGQQ